MLLDQGIRYTNPAARAARHNSFLTRAAWGRVLGTLLVLAGFMASVGTAQAQTYKRVSGYMPAGTTWYFYPRVPNNSALDTIYQIAGDLHVGGKLQISEGAEVWFLDNSRLIDSAGGKVIANGYSGLPGTPSLNRRILFRGSPVGDSSFEWGHFIILPNSDSAFFSNVRFTNFRKRNSVDATDFYNPNLDAADAAYNNALNSAVDGVGGVIATFSQKTFIYDAIVDSCRASFAGGAFAFLQAPSGFQHPLTPTVDDGRIALRNKQVGTLTIRDTKVFNNEVIGTGLVQTYALGGAIYMASNSSSYLATDSVTALLGYNGFTTGTPSNPVVYTQRQDTLIFERCAATNTFGTTTPSPNFAEGGAIYVGSNTALIVSNAAFNADSANMPTAALDLNSWGGAIAVSSTSGSPAENIIERGNAADRLPGLAIMKTATFDGCVAGVGGAINLANPNPQFSTPVPRLIINAENKVTSFPGFIGPVRDSGLIQFTGNVAYAYGGAIYSPNEVYITGYLAPSNFPWPGGFQAVELRVKFFNNVAGIAGGSTYLDASGVVGIGGGTPDLVERRAWHLQNSVNPADPRVNRYSQYSGLVIGGGAEFVGLRDSTFATEYNSNFVIGGNGGAVNLQDGIVTGLNQPATNRYFVENQYNAQNVTIARDTDHTPTGSLVYSPFPYDQRELTRFLNNMAILGPDSANLYNFTPGANSENTAHGRGGGLYMQITSTASDVAAIDSTFMSRVRFEKNQAYSGSAIWCDRYDMKIMTNQSLFANNIATSPSSRTVDLMPNGISNPSDPNAGAAIWADFEGPMPSYESNSRGDAIYDNQGRYILRLPVSYVNGVSGVDTLRGNFWGNTGPDLVTEENPPTGVAQNTFFIDYYKGCFENIYEPNSQPPIAFQAVKMGTLPDTLLMEGRVYDEYDGGTNMKVADYSNRRLAPSEAFSLAEPAQITKMHRFTRDIFDTNLSYLDKIDDYQTDFVGPHPIGYPLFLQADVPIADTNRDDYARDYTTFIVLNVTTNEFVRVNLKETVAAESDTAPQQTFRGRLDFIPDSSVAERHPNLRNSTLYTLSLIRPNTMTFAEVQRASMLEDSAALKGREYSLSPTDLVPAGDTTDPVYMDCESGGQKNNTMWYAGEKYHTLPVRPGDQIEVISRTVLWKYGAAAAVFDGLSFTIGNVQPPNFIVDIPALQQQTINPNILFVKRQINYDGSTKQKTLFRVAGYDANAFYDPRFLFNPGNYTQLGISVTPNFLTGDVLPTGANIIATNALDSLKNRVRLNWWLRDTVIYNQNITGSNGYILLKGQPLNPDIVPGGESLTATITNFPPDYNSETLLKQAYPSPFLGPDSNALSFWLYPPEMNCERNDTNTAIIPIPDTMCIAASSATYTFKIIVQDSLPVFDTLPRACGFSYPVAILTDSLRYSINLGTDVEHEDSNASLVTEAASHVGDNNTYYAWPGPDFNGVATSDPLGTYRDFPYGRTSYRFVTEPSWIATPSGGNNYSQLDSANLNFLRYGIVNVRIDSFTAVGANWTPSGAFGSYLLPFPQNGNALNLDSVIAVEANDGHTGKIVKQFPVTILFAPTIETDSLPDAKEGVDFSLNFNNANLVKQIHVQNLNPEQPYTYALLYQGQTDTLYRDFPDKVPAQPYTGSHFVGGAKDTVVGKTPNWIHIDPFSGTLTGTPGDTDAPKVAGTPCGGDTLTVIVTNGQIVNGQPVNYCVAAWTQIPLNVDSVNHPPHFIVGPQQLCVISGEQFCDSVKVYDPDLLRTCAPDTLTLSDSVGQYGSGFSFHIGGDSINVIPGTLSNDTTTFQICGTYTEEPTYFSTKPLIPEKLKLAVHDADSAWDSIYIQVHIGEQPAFECGVCVSNTTTQLHPLADMQQLYFGAAADATDSLDQQYCEYELGPVPPSSVFDARWVLPSTRDTTQSYGLEGTTVDIRQNANAEITWQIQFQPGDDNGSAGSLYPVQICWNRSCLDSSSLKIPFNEGHFYLRDPQSAQEFSINMATGQGPIDNSLYTLLPVGSDSECLQIRNQGLINAIIVFQPGTSGVVPMAEQEFGIQPNYPNPFGESTTLNFSVASHSMVTINIYDVKGALVRTIINEQFDPGSYPVTWDGTDASGASLPDGTYIATMNAGSFTGSVKMTLERNAQ